MTRRELIEFCRMDPDVMEDNPFADGHSTIMRHRENRRWFAVIFEQNGKLCMNLKCEPMEADFLRSVYQDVSPAWHMNKVHWNTIAVNGDVPEQVLHAMVERSFELTKTGRRAPKTKDRGPSSGAR